MAIKTNYTVNGYDYYRLTKVVGKKRNKNGKLVPVRKFFTGKSKKEATEKMEAYMLQQSIGVLGGNEYFGIIADEWISNIFINIDTLKTTTKQRYLSAWNLVIKPSDIYNMPIESVSALSIQEIYNNSTAPASTIKAANKLMRRFYKYIVTAGYGRDITGALAVPTTNKPASTKDEIVVWGDMELHRIFSGFGIADSRFRLRFLLFLAYFSGARISELLALRYEDITSRGVNINKQTYRVPRFARDGIEELIQVGEPKSPSSIRIIPINQSLLTELEVHKQWHFKEMLRKGYTTNYIFTSANGKLLDKKAVAKACERYYKRIGVPYKSLHTYRHTFATNLCKNGVPIQVASELLGHSDINVTKKYYVFIHDDTKQEAVNKLQDPSKITVQI